MTAILSSFFLVLLQKQTFLHQSTHQPIYILISNILCSANVTVGRNLSPLPRYFVISLWLNRIKTVTLSVTCHIRLREATFSHENMLVSLRKKYHQTWGALGSDKKLASNKVCRNTENYLLLSTGNISMCNQIVTSEIRE